MNLATRLHLVLRLRMNGAIPLLLLRLHSVKNFNFSLVGLSIRNLSDLVSFF
jgi:hypothetical protein